MAWLPAREGDPAVGVSVVEHLEELRGRLFFCVAQLTLAVMERAIDDLVHNRFAKTRCGQRAYWDAYDWVAAEDREWPFSFVTRPRYDAAQQRVCGTVRRRLRSEVGKGCLNST